MRIKDDYGIYRDVQVPIDLERQLYQKGSIKYGQLDFNTCNRYVSGGNCWEDGASGAWKSNINL